MSASYVTRIIETVWCRSSLSTSNFEKKTTIESKRVCTAPSSNTTIPSNKPSFVVITNVLRTCCSFSMNIFLP
ncbi:hypothetical protein PHET_00463 [Paragonimus heterotremus]|uniref:Uncharacterized protein n=1 Tax=Paragonimus heterotremus TaxID=100268 RepID=A0A8J4WM38_9TREM|nr:hypothetical protein PHET_00463 [Paragonimus heterotremus]